MAVAEDTYWGLLTISAKAWDLNEKNKEKVKMKPIRTLFKILIFFIYYLAFGSNPLSESWSTIDFLVVGSMRVIIKIKL